MLEGTKLDVDASAESALASLRDPASAEEDGCVDVDAGGVAFLEAPNLGDLAVADPAFPSLCAVASLI